MISGKFECRKFSANMFNLTKCQHCFRPKEQHTAEALECSRASRKISKCGYLFVAPDWDFSVPVNRTKRWQRRWFVLYEDGELTYSVDEHPDTIPQAVVDMTKVIEVSDAEEVTGSKFAIAITTQDKVHFVKGTCKEESKWWFDVLVGFPRNNKSKPKRNATFTSIKTTVSPTQVSCTHQSWCVAYPQVETSALLSSSRCCQQLADSSRMSSVDNSDLVVPTRNIEIIIADSHTHHSFVDSHCANRAKARRETQLQVSSSSEELSTSHITPPTYSRLSDIPVMKRYESLEDLNVDHSQSLCSPRTSFCHAEDRIPDTKEFSHLHHKPVSTSEGTESWKENTVRGDPDGCGLDQIVYSPSSPGEMIRIDALDHLPKNMYHVKKGWLLRQDFKTGDWYKKWCVLYSTHMKIFQDQSSEERGSLDYVIYMNHVQHVEEVDVNRNYGFKMMLTDGSCHVFSAVTSGIRSGWVSVLKNSANLCGMSDELMVHLSLSSNSDMEQKLPAHSKHSLDDQAGSLGKVSMANISTTAISSNSSSSGNGNSRIPPLSPPLNRTAISKVKERAKLKTTNKVNPQKSVEKASEDYKDDELDANTDKMTHRKNRGRRYTLPTNADPTLKESNTSCSSSRSSLPGREGISQLSRNSERTKGVVSQNRSKSRKEYEGGSSNEQTRTPRHLVSLKLTLDNSNLESDSIHLGGEKKIHLGSLSDLTNIGKEVDTETVPRDTLAHKYQELRNRFEKAVEEIRALQKELKDAHYKCDHLEVTCMNKKREVDAIENDYQSQLNLMSVRIEDLTTKLNLSEKQLRLQPKPTKSNGGSVGKEQRRTRSLKGKDNLTVSKEVENKVEELEKKLKNVEGVLNFRSIDNTSLSFNSESDKAPEKPHLFVRLNSLEAKVEEAASKVLSSQHNWESNDDRSSYVESEVDASMRLTVSELMTKIDHLCKRVMQLEDALSRCRVKVELAKSLIGSDSCLESVEEYLNDVINCLDTCLVARQSWSCDRVQDRSECFHEVILRRVQWIKAALDSMLMVVEGGGDSQWPQWSVKSIDSDVINNMNSIIDELEPLKTSMGNQIQPWLNTTLKLLALRVSSEIGSGMSFEDASTVIRLKESFLVVLADLVGRVTDSDLGDVWSHLLISGEKESLWPRILEETLSALKGEVLTIDSKGSERKCTEVSEEKFSFVAGGYSFLTLAIDSLTQHLKAMNNSLNNHRECEKRKETGETLNENNSASSTPRIVGEVMKKNEKDVECQGCTELHRRMKHMAEKHANELLTETERHETKLENAVLQQQQLLVAQKEEKGNECERYKSEVDQLQDRLRNLEDDYEEQLVSLKQMFEAELAKRVDVQINITSVQHKYKSEIEQLKTLCEKGLAAMEHSHKRIVAELEEKWKRKSEKLQAEKEQALAEETKATLSALDAMRKAHEAELQKEVARFKEEFLEKMGHSSADLDALHKEHEEEMETIKREILSLSQKYSVKCLECVALDEHLETKHRELAEANALIIDLTARNKQLRSHLKQNVKELSSMKVDSSSDLLISLRLREGQLLEKEEEISDLCRKLGTLQTTMTVENENSMPVAKLITHRMLPISKSSVAGVVASKKKIFELTSDVSVDNSI